VNAKYTIRQMFWDVDRYEVLNPSRVPIAKDLSWRVARKIADALNEQRETERRRANPPRLPWGAGAVSLQEEKA
jgi:hypothetical protein